VRDGQHKAELQHEVSKNRAAMVEYLQLQVVQQQSAARPRWRMSSGGAGPSHTLTEKLRDINLRCACAWVCIPDVVGG
jgi:hypothetical protein